ncbi:MAG: substrate-binding domain-containing protein [Eubacteriales bacterium]
MKIRRILTGILAGMLVSASIVGCAGSDSDTISVISRENGSGTRGAFIELFGIEEADENGEKVDRTTTAAEQTQSTGVMLSTVAGNKNAIGYVSLGSLDDSVKALAIDGTEATVDNIKNGSYKIARPFNIVTKDGLSDVAQDFIAYIMSADGQAVIEANGYVSEGNAGAYSASGFTGTIVVAGSSSVTPVMQKLKEAYVALNPDVTIEVQESDSTTGVNSTIDGICDIGMASRDLKDAEVAAGLSSTKICIDGVAVIVNKELTVDGLTSEQVKKIFTGEITKWSEIG